MLSLETKKLLIEEAKISSTFSYSPYSNFAVGAALLTSTGSIIRGTNIENISFGLSNCAERTAIYTALSQGVKEFEAIAIYSPNAQQYLSPCGSCRQVIREFFSPTTPIFLSNQYGEFLETTIKELLPMSFDTLNSLNKI